jgi:cysteine desulfurase/selenocysteine lyase
VSPAAEPFSPAERAAIRAEFPHLEGRAYLNYASVGPMPVRARVVVDRINETLQRLDSNFDAETDVAIVRARAAMAKLVGGQAEEVGLLPNTSYGINWAFGFFGLQPGDKVLISDHEFPALRYAALHLQTFGIEVVFARVSPKGGLQPDPLRLLLEEHPEVKVVATSWVSFHNGFRHDVRALADVAHEHGAYFLVDAIQGLGTRPMDAPAWGIDVLASAVHKWLLCPVGLAFVWCAPELVHTMVSPWAGWMSVDWGADYSDLFGPPKQFLPGPRAAEAGTTNFAGVRALAEVGEWLVELGPARIEAHTQSLLDILEAGLDPDRYEVVSDRQPAHRSAIICLRPRHADAARLRQFLAQNGVIAVVREGAVRLSPHFPTERSDVEHLVQSLHEFA